MKLVANTEETCNKKALIDLIRAHIVLLTKDLNT